LSHFVGEIAINIHTEGSDTLEQVAQGGCGLPHPWMHSGPGWMWLWAAWSGGWQPCT